MPRPYNDETRNSVIARRCIEPVEMYEAIQIESFVSGLLRSARNDDLTSDAGSPLQPRSSVSDFVISPYDIVIFSFTPAHSGTDTNTKGINGKFEFRVTPPETRMSAYKDGIIIATPFDATGNISTSLNDRISTLLNDRLRAWTQNGILYVDGLTPGTTWRVYNLTGTLIYTGTVSERSRTIGTRLIAPQPAPLSAPLPAKGIYIVTNGNETVKVVY